jgi:hypothetical protein
LDDFKDYSPLKHFGQMIRNMVGSIYWLSSIKSAHFVPIHWQTLPPQVLEIDQIEKRIAYGGHVC